MQDHTGKEGGGLQIAIDGGDVVGFLRKNGSVTPDKLWWYIKNQCKQKDPETYAKLPQPKKAEKKIKTIKAMAETEIEPDGTVTYKMTGKQLAEVTDKVPDVIVVPHDAIEKAESYPTVKAMTRKEHREAHSRTKTTLTMDERGVRIEQKQEPDLKVKSLFSNVIEGAFFAKGERGVQMSIRTYPTMTLVAKSNPFGLDNQLKDCKLELTKEEWLKLTDEIHEALQKMEI